jgi:site-specific recombinase XerD
MLTTSSTPRQNNKTLFSSMPRLCRRRRTVPLSPDLLKTLSKLKEERKPKQDDHVFMYDGQPWKAWRRSFNTAKKKAGIKDFRWHDLRHCFGSWLAANGVPDKARMELMGHKTLEMTAKYTRLSDGYKRQAIANLPQFKPEILEAAKAESQQISQQAETANVVNFSR